METIDKVIYGLWANEQCASFALKLKRKETTDGKESKKCLLLIDHRGRCLIPCALPICAQLCSVCLVKKKGETNSDIWGCTTTGRVYPYLLLDWHIETRNTSTDLLFNCQRYNTQRASLCRYAPLLQCFLCAVPFCAIGSCQFKVRKRTYAGIRKHIYNKEERKI